MNKRFGEPSSEHRFPDLTIGNPKDATTRWRVHDADGNPTHWETRAGTERAARRNLLTVKHLLPKHYALRRVKE